MVLLRAKLMLILINYITMTMTASPTTPTCPLPRQAKTGDQSSVQITVFRCSQHSETAKNVCTNKGFKATLRKDLVTNLDYDNHGYALLAKFYGREICVSYRTMILSHMPGRPLENRTSCESDCFADSKMVVIEYDSVCDATKCLQAKQNLHFIVNSGSRRFHSYGRRKLLEVGLVLIIWLIK
jgi:hypothetical protein